MLQLFPEAAAIFLTLGETFLTCSVLVELKLARPSTTENDKLFFETQVFKPIPYAQLQSAANLRIQESIRNCYLHYLSEETPKS
jgi:hypothetical protein